MYAILDRLEKIEDMISRQDLTMYKGSSNNNHKRKREDWEFQAPDHNTFTFDEADVLYYSFYHILRVQGEKYFSLQQDLHCT